MNKTDQLKHIRAAIGKLLGTLHDDVHRQADEQLLLTIRTLTRGTRNEQVGKEIIELYKRMEKWYA